MKITVYCLRGAVAALALLVAGCPSIPSPDEIRAADVGGIPQDAEKQVHEWLRENLKDYDTARIELAVEPLRDYTNAERGREYRVTYGWRFDGRVNAKNSFGGYIGWRRYEFFFIDGRLSVVRKETEKGGSIDVFWRA